MPICAQVCAEYPPVDQNRDLRAHWKVRTSRKPATRPPQTPMTHAYAGATAFYATDTPQRSTNPAQAKYGRLGRARSRGQAHKLVHTNLARLARPHRGLHGTVSIGEQSGFVPSTARDAHGPAHGLASREAGMVGAANTYRFVELRYLSAWRWESPLIPITMARPGFGGHGTARPPPRRTGTQKAPRAGAVAGAAPPAITPHLGRPGEWCPGSARPRIRLWPRLTACHTPTVATAIVSERPEAGEARAASLRNRGNSVRLVHS